MRLKTDLIFVGGLIVIAEILRAIFWGVKMERIEYLRITKEELTQMIERKFNIKAKNIKLSSGGAKVEL